MKTLRALSFAVVAFAAAPHAAHAAHERPNIIFVLFDDLGWGQPQSYNPTSALRTPNLDKLAKIPDNAGEDSVSLLPELLGTTPGGAREATVHQPAGGDLAIRQGPWKMIFQRGGQRELYNLQADLSETKDVLAANAEVAGKMTTLMQGGIDNGRSTAGPAQKNDFDLSINGDGKGKRKRKDQRVEAAVKSPAERAREMALAADGSFD